MIEKLKHGVLIISARRGYVTNGWRKAGYTVLYPYRDKTLVGRVFRELWFRLGLPESVWYSRECLQYAPTDIEIHDPQITAPYLLWIQKSFPESAVAYHYGNLVGRARHLLPTELPKGIVPVTYDEADSKKYGMVLQTDNAYFSCYVTEKKSLLYDVFFVGADKGRGAYLLQLKEKFERAGLKTHFIICPDGRFKRRKSYQRPPIAYEAVVDLVAHSRAILNITLPGQMGATMRDFEALFSKSKLITNNRNIKNFDFYRRENIFILGEDDFAGISDFVNSPFVEVPTCISDKYLIK